MKIIRYRTLWAWGKTRWLILIVPDGIRIRDKLAMEAFFKDQGVLSNWSDKWRGLEYKELRKPPKEFLEKAIERRNANINDIQKEITTLGNMLKKHDKGETNEKKCTCPLGWEPNKDGHHSSCKLFWDE